MGKASNQDEDQPKDDSSTITQKQGYWQETCIGVWTRNKNQSQPSPGHPTHPHICNGINFVKVFVSTSCRRYHQLIHSNIL